MAGQQLNFFIAAIPRGQSRVRHTSVNGFTRSYKDAKQRADERTLEALMMPYVPAVCLSGAIELRIMAYLPVPQSRSKKWQDKAIRGGVYPTTKPDADNIAKNITDCLVRMRFIEDDKLIVSLSILKIYGDKPGYSVGIKELTE